MDVVQIEHWNPGASMPLILPVHIQPNTHADIVDANVRANSRLDVPWLYECPAHDGVAVICGGGPSLADDIERIREMSPTATVFGLNGASGRLTRDGIPVDYQVIIDAQEITTSLVDVKADDRLYASHVHPATAKYADMFFHLNFAGCEDLFPPEKVEMGGYTLVGGGVSVGITALVVAYTLGYRKLHLFGYDSSNRDGATHAYSQPHNKAIPTIDIEWAGKTYNCSMPMKLQAEAFLRISKQLREEGCEITVHGSGLLPAMCSETPRTEREKYQLLWALGDYRGRSFGEEIVEKFLDVASPVGRVVDFGCGTGRAALRLAEQGYDVTAIDFCDNARDKEAIGLRFIQWDLTRPIPVKGDVGYCTDVMEHIPPEDVDTVIANILASTPRAFFQIATFPDVHGSTIGQTLHLTVQDHEWWAAKFDNIIWQERTELHSCFYVETANV
jgi:SAM-dependent methyltransferase/uncharacterized Rossmann fold enzyme